MAMLTLKNLRVTCLPLYVLLFCGGFSAASALADPATVSGKVLYETYCSLCHGSGGRGDGRLSRVINDPPPANLVESDKPRAYLLAIVAKGGAVMARSEKMPSWEHELGESGVASVVDYILTLR